MYKFLFGDGGCGLSLFNLTCVYVFYFLFIFLIVYNLDGRKKYMNVIINENKNVF